MRVHRSVTLALLVASGAYVQAQQSPAPPRRGGNPDAAKTVNPVVASPESLSAGRRAYTQFCANCHGATGRGDGRGAPAGTQVPDLTDVMWDYGSTDGDIFAVIHDGVSADMGPYAERMKDADIWNVVNYIRALAAAK